MRCPICDAVGIVAGAPPEPGGLRPWRLWATLAGLAVALVGLLGSLTYVVLFAPQPVPSTGDRPARAPAQARSAGEGAEILPPRQPVEVFALGGAGYQVTLLTDDEGQHDKTRLPTGCERHRLNDLQILVRPLC